MAINLKKGLLYLIGGKEDRHYDKFVLKKLLDLSKPKHITLIPSASSYPLEMAREYKDAFGDLGVKNIDVLDIRYADETDEERNIKIIENTDLVFFSGGDQVRLAELFLGSRLLNTIIFRHNNGLTVAGSSAGAHIASDEMLYYGERRGLIKGSVKSSKGFGFVKIVIDTHFSNRKRIYRLSQFLAAHSTEIGIGLDEDTAIAIKNDNTFEVVGSGLATIIKKSENFVTNYKEVREREPISIDGLQVSFLNNGMKYDLNRFTLLKFKKLA